MKGALELWLFLATLIIGAVVLAVVLLGPAALIIWLTGQVWIAFTVVVVSLIAFVTSLAWTPPPRWVRWINRNVL